MSRVATVQTSSGDWYSVDQAGALIDELRAEVERLSQYEPCLSCGYPMGRCKCEPEEDVAERVVRTEQIAHSKRIPLDACDQFIERGTEAERVLKSQRCYEGCSGVPCGRCARYDLMGG